MFHPPLQQRSSDRKGNIRGVALSSLTVGAPGTIPTPELITDPTMLSPANGEQWEGVLVTATGLLSLSGLYLPQRTGSG